LKEFKNARYSDISINVEVMFKRTIKFFTLKDMELDYETILNHLIKRNSSSELKASTRKKYLLQLRRFFNYCVEREYFKKNPVDVIGIPQVPAKKLNNIFEKGEVNAIVDYFLNRTNMVEYGILYKFLSQTGCRIGEALSLKWEDVKEDGFLIHGKGGYERPFPLINIEDNSTLFPEVIELFNQLRLINKDKVFHWKYPAQPQYHLNEALNKLQIPKIKNEIHNTKETRES